MSFEILTEGGGFILSESGSPLQYEHVPATIWPRRFVAPFAASRITPTGNPSSSRGSIVPERARARGPNDD